jgi:hypothetical protein
MEIKRVILCCGCAALFLAAGCAQSRVAMDYGTSFELQKYNQTLNAAAEKNLEPVTGLSGKAAQKAEEKYEKSFEKTEKAATSYQINVGSIGK